MIDVFFKVVVSLLICSLLFFIGQSVYENLALSNYIEKHVNVSFEKNKTLTDPEIKKLKSMIYKDNLLPDENIKSEVLMDNGSNLLRLSIKNLKSDECYVVSKYITKENIDEILINSILFISEEDARINNSNKNKILIFRDALNFCELKYQSDVIFIKQLNMR